MCTEIPDIILGKQWLINDSNKAVLDAFHGLVKCHPHLALLDHCSVVVQRDHLQRKHVKIISGGPSGHEPSFAGFVGSGMLTAAVQGGIYSSPTPELILRTIKELARRHDKGILIIINDNMSDRLSFGIAVERALHDLNIKVRFLQIDDNCHQNVDRRGMVGCLLVQKIAGAMAEEGAFLFDIYVFCKDLLDHIATVSVCLKPAISPYFEISACARTISQNVEYGAGPHGQVGFVSGPLLSSHKTVRVMLNFMCEQKPQFKLAPDVPVVVLVNNFSQASILEKLIVINEVVTQLQSRGITIQRVYCGNYFTSLGMYGFSLTILNLTNPNIINYLDAKTDAPYWTTFGEVITNPDVSLVLDTTLSAKEKQLTPNRGPKFSPTAAQIIEHAINFACGALISCEEQLNIIDSESGDGDTGTNIRSPARRITDYLTKKKLSIQWPFKLFKELSKLLEFSSENIICRFYAIMFEAAAKPLTSLKETDEMTIVHWEQIFNSICKSVKRYGCSQFGRNTMFDALHKANIAFTEAVAANSSPLDCVGSATRAAEEAVKLTKLPQALQPDPGAHAVGIWMRAVYETLKLYPDYCQ